MKAEWLVRFWQPPALAMPAFPACRAWLPCLTLACPSAPFTLLPPAGEWHCSEECERIRAHINAAIQGQQMDIPGYPGHTWQARAAVFSLLRGQPPPDCCRGHCSPHRCRQLVFIGRVGCGAH